MLCLTYFLLYMSDNYHKSYFLLLCVCLMMALFAFAPATTQAKTAKKAKVAVTAPTAAFYYEKDLELNDEGPDVLALQKHLVKKGYLKITKPSPEYGYNPNGFFGEQTKAALIKWQKANDISPATGALGPKSRALLNKNATAKVNAEPKVELATVEVKTPQATAAESTVTTTPTTTTTTTIRTTFKACTYFVYSDWSACSIWGNQTRSIISSAPEGCAGGDFILEQVCPTSTPSASSGQAATTSTLTIATSSDGITSAMIESLIQASSTTSSGPETLDDRLLSAAFLDNGLKVGLQCKPWVSKVVSVVTNNAYNLPVTARNNYTWKIPAASRVLTKNCDIESASRGDIIQMTALRNDLPHTAIIAATTPTGMVWVHSNWLKKKTVTVDFVTYDYFKDTYGRDYSVYHLQ